MKIVIAGLGNVGSSICSHLAEDGHDITLVDTRIEKLNDLSNRYDIFGIEGNAANVSVLRKANVDKADLCIAVTPSDEINILCCSAAKRIGAKHTIARVRNQEYSELIQLMKKDVNLSMTINPELSVAKEIFRSLRYPSATKIEFCCHGRVELAEFVVPHDSVLCGTSLNELRSKLNTRFLVCSVLRDDKVIIPSGDFVINEGDTLSVTAPEREVVRFFKAIGVYKQPVKDLLIVGGGRISHYLASLLDSGKIKATVIEKDKNICRDFVEEYDCNVVCADGFDQSVLLENGLDKTDAFLALSDSDEGNAITSLLAKSHGVPKIITLIGSIPYIELFKKTGLDGFASTVSSTTTSILKFIRSTSNVRGSEIEALHRIMDDKVEVLEFYVKEEIVGLTGVALKDLKLIKGVLIACIVHNDKVVIPGGNDSISMGDRVIVVTSQEQIKGIKEILK